MRIISFIAIQTKTRRTETRARKSRTLLVFEGVRTSVAPYPVSPRLRVDHFTCAPLWLLLRRRRRRAARLRLSPVFARLGLHLAAARGKRSHLRLAGYGRQR